MEPLEAPRRLASEEGGPRFWKHHTRDSPVPWLWRRTGKAVYVIFGGKKQVTGCFRPRPWDRAHSSLSCEVSLDALHNVHPRITGMGEIGQQA